MTARSRRDFALDTAFFLGALAWLDTTMGGSSVAAEPPELPALNRFPRMIQDYLVGHVRDAHRRSLQAKQAVDSKESALRYQQEVREKIIRCFGPLPERTPLNARVIRIHQREGYRIENVIFESRPNFPVTANLYLPESDRSVPGVVGSCGHSANGKAAEAYQAFAQGLAKLGLACLLFDPLGQGERLQFPLPDGKSQYGPGVREHLQCGNQQFLVGEFLGTWRAWDGIRALDYLLTRSEIDPNHLGITGNSGGGTMTTWLCGLESRWTMAAPACFVTNFLANAENELPADTEQCPPSALALGLEHEDFLAVLAPKPVAILAKERDYFDVRGSEAAHQRLQKLYRWLEQPNQVHLHVGPSDHGFSIENREAMYAHFLRAIGSAAQPNEPELTIEADATLWCTDSGQVAELGAATVPDFTRLTAEQLQQQRRRLRGPELQQAIRQVLQLPQQTGDQPPHYRILREAGPRGYPCRHFTTYAVETEPPAMAVCYLLTNQPHYSRPPRLGRQARLYISHRSSDLELRQQAWLRQRVDPEDDRPFFACDVRGIGESQPNTCGLDSFDSPYGNDYFYAIHGIMLDRPYLGQKTWDVLRVLDWLKSLGYDQIELIGHGWGSQMATLAAVLNPHVTSVILHQALDSYHQLAIDANYRMPLAYLPPGVLKHFDLPDCYAELSDRLERITPSS